MKALLRFWVMLSFWTVVGEDLNAQMAWNSSLVDQWSASGIALNPQGAGYSDLCGFVINGRRYAALCSTEGVHVLELLASGEIVERDFVPGAFQSPNVVNRDVAFYDHVLYAVCDHGFSTLQVIDVSYLPDSVHVVYDSDQYFQRAHSLVVDTQGEKLLACGVSSTINGDRAMDVFSIANPETPVFLGSFTNVQYVHDAYARNDTAWLNCAFDGLVIVKFSDPFSIQIIGDLPTYPENGYNHSGCLSLSGMQYVFTDETPGKRIKLCDVSDINDIQIQSLFHAGTNSQNMAHNVVMHDPYVLVSHYRDGLQIFDVSDPVRPIRVAWYDPHAQDGFQFSGAWGIHYWPDEQEVLISDMQLGLLWLKVNFPPILNTQRQEVGWAPNPASGTTWFWRNSARLFPLRLTVTSMTGNAMVDLFIPAVDRFMVDVSSWPSGVYSYTVSGTEADVFYSGKLVVVAQ